MGSLGNRPGLGPAVADLELENAAVRNAFYHRILHDRAAGIARSVGAYQALFPGWEALIAVEHRSLETVSEPPERPDAVESRAPTAGCGSECPDRVGRYDVRGILGKGGMGIVYLAEDPTLSRTVVLKTLRTDEGGPVRVEAFARLIREARIGGRLDIDGICPVLDFVEEKGRFYVVLPFIPGKSLAELMGEPRDRPAISTAHDVLAFLKRLAGALHQAHEAGVVHRDLKPANVMVRPEGLPVILDFGLAAETAGGAGPDLTQDGDVFGTPRYMAPEQIEGRTQDIDRRTDVYALGVMLYEMIARERPFEAPSKTAVYRLILEGRYRPLRAVAPGVSRNLDAVCAKAMAKDRERRYATAAELARDLGALLEGRPTIARPPSWPARVVHVVRSHRVAAAVLLACLLAAIALIVWNQRGRSGRSVDYLQAYDRYRDAFDRFQEADCDQARLTASDLDLLLGPFRDSGDHGSLLRDPFSPETYLRIKKHARGLPRGRADRPATEFRLRGPRGVVTTDRPTFRFERAHGPVESSSVFLRLEDDSQGVERIPLAEGARGAGPVSFTLPAGWRLVRGRKYAWGLVDVAPATDSAPAAERIVSERFDLVVVSAGDRDALLQACPRTGRESLDLLIRAGVLIGHDCLDDGLAELDRVPHGASVRDRACALMLRAEAAYHMDDEETFDRFRGEALSLGRREPR